MSFFERTTRNIRRVDRMGDIDEVKQRTDIVAVIGQYISLRKAGRNLTGLCPFHGEKNPSFFVFPEQQSWHCFGCNEGGDAFSFLMKREGLSFGEALRLLAARAGVDLPSRPGDDAGEKDRLRQLNEAAARFYHDMLLNSPAGEKARSYLAGRGLDPQAIAAFQLGFSPNSWEMLKKHLLEKGHSDKDLLHAGLLIQADDGTTHDRFRGRLMFPIRDPRGQAIGFGARALDDSMPKYLNSPQTAIFDKSGSLYALDRAAPAIRQGDRAVIVEGYMDAITAHQHGATDVVAAMGTSITERQVTALKKLTRNLVLALDADSAGEEAMQRGIGYENVLGAEIKVVALPPGKDPDDVIKQGLSAWRQLVEQAVPLVDYTIDMVTRALDIASVAGKTAATERLLPVLAGITDPVRQAHHLQRLSRRLGVAERTIEAALGSFKAGLRPRQVRSPSRALRPLKSDPLEEYSLALLLQYPGINAEGLLPDYFQRSENRQVFIAWQHAPDREALRERLDAAIHPHLDDLLNKEIPATGWDRRYDDCAQRLRERFLRNLEAKRAEVFALEAETAGSGADLTRLEQEGIDTAIQLRELHRSRRRP